MDFVPPEILSHIFRITLQAGDVSISSRVGPLLVSQVSQRWRHVAISDSVLWATFKIDISPTTAAGHSSIVKLWLDRSSCQPLSITVCMDPFSHMEGSTSKVMQDIFTVLTSVSTRWKNLNLSLPNYSQKFCLGLCSAHSPILESLSFKLGNWSADEASQINTLLQYAPTLQKLTWSNRSSWASWDSPFDSGIEQLQAPWHSLTSVCLDTWITYKSAINILSYCHSIVHLDLRHFSYGPDTLGQVSSFEGTLICLLHLESITIYQLKLDEGLSALLDRLNCPNLKAFHYTCGFVELYTWPQSSFHNFLVHSKCSLQALMLEFTGITEPQLTQCLEQSSATLKKLEIYDARGDICVTDDLLKKMAVHKSVWGKFNGILFPNLETLILHNVVDCSDGALATTLRTRSVSYLSRIGAPCNPLHFARVHFSKRFKVTNKADIEYLDNQMDIMNMNVL